MTADSFPIQRRWLFQGFAKEGELLISQRRINSARVSNKEQFERTISLFSDKLFPIHQRSNETGRCRQQGQDASVDQFLGELSSRRLGELEQNFGFRFIKTPVPQLRYGFVQLAVVPLVFEQIHFQMIHGVLPLVVVVLFSETPFSNNHGRRAVKNWVTVRYNEENLLNFVAV